MKGLVQIAGIRSLEEARMLLQAGVDWLGFPLRLELHREDLPAEEVSRIIASLGIGDRAVLITYLADALAIARLAAMLGCRRVQLHGDITAGEVLRLKEADAGLCVIKALIVRPGNLDERLNGLRDFAPFVNAFITDTWDPQTGARGATGKTHDWKPSRRIVESAIRPVILYSLNAEELFVTEAREVFPATVVAKDGLVVGVGVRDWGGVVRSALEQPTLVRHPIHTTHNSQLTTHNAQSSTLPPPPSSARAGSSRPGPRACACR